MKVSWKCKACNSVTDESPKITLGDWKKIKYSFLRLFNRSEYFSRHIFACCPVCGFKNFIYFESKDSERSEIIKSLPIRFMAGDKS